MIRTGIASQNNDTLNHTSAHTTLRATRSLDALPTITSQGADTQRNNVRRARSADALPRASVRTQPTATDVAPHRVRRARSVDALPRPRTAAEIEAQHTVRRAHSDNAIIGRREPAPEPQPQLFMGPNLSLDALSAPRLRPLSEFEMQEVDLEAARTRQLTPRVRRRLIGAGLVALGLTVFLGSMVPVAAKYGTKRLADEKAGTTPKDTPPAVLIPATLGALTGVGVLVTGIVFLTT